uniref:Uncharacterized protein n=1 Tax=Anopheles merus TaxID=30066 RepID=A0A182USW7_ANOME
MWGEVLYGAGHQYDTALLPALVRQRPFGGLWPPEEPPAARSARKRPRAAHGARPEAATHLGVVGVGAGSYGFCSPAAPATTTTGLMQGGVLPKPDRAKAREFACRSEHRLGFGSATCAIDGGWTEAKPSKTRFRDHGSKSPGIFCLLLLLLMLLLAGIIVLGARADALVLAGIFKTLVRPNGVDGLCLLYGRRKASDRVSYPERIG